MELQGSPAQTARKSNTSAQFLRASAGQVWVGMVMAVDITYRLMVHQSGEFLQLAELSYSPGRSTVHTSTLHMGLHWRAEGCGECDYRITRLSYRTVMP